MRCCKLLLFFILISFGVNAQTGTVRGIVVDEDSGDPLIGATAVIEGTGKGSITNLDGEFMLENVNPGSFTLQISYIGYETYEDQIEVNAGETVDVGSISLPVVAVGLEAVEVFASVVEDRKTPVAVSSINAEEIQERFQGASLAEIAQYTPGVYAVQGAGGYGDEELYIRGFDQSNIAFLINGIPVNDMENGRMYWSNFAGLNEITRQMQIQRGLGASKLAISSIGGTVNMISSPAGRKEGGRIEYQFGTGSWNERLRFTYHTGENNGWSASFQGSRTTTNPGLIGKSSADQGSITPGAYTDAWSYYLTVSKKINEKHQLQFWGFGAPVDRGTSWTADDATRKAFRIDEPTFNNALGIYRGELLNARQNKLHKPMMALTHYWDLNPSSNISTSVYFSHANVYSTQPNDAESSLFFPERNPGDPHLTRDNLINWDYLAEQNNNFMTIQNPNGDPYAAPISGNRSRYYLEARYNNHNWIGLISNYRKTFENFSVLGGIDLRHYRGKHYAKVHELFGGDFVLNQSSFGDVQNILESSINILDTQDATATESDDYTNDIAREGDYVNYNYDGNINWAAAFVQGEYNFDKFDVFATATLSYSDYYRVGNFWNGRDIYIDNSLGKSEVRNFVTYTAKAGLNFRPTNRHNIFANAGIFTRPPYMDNMFADARYSNKYREGLSAEQIYSAEVGYGYRTGSLKLNLNGYYTVWNDRTTEYNITDEEFDFFSQTEQLPIVLTGLQSLHTGVEFDITWDVTSGLELSGYASLGDWKWNNSPVTTVTLTDESGETSTTDVLVPLKGLPVGSTAQTTAGFGFHYSGINNMYIGSRLQYSDRISVRYFPEDVIDGYIDNNIINDEFDDYYTLDIYMGRYFDISDEVSGRISAHVNNVTNEEYVRWASYFYDEFQRGYAYPRTYTISLQISF